jgi:hypothetical protein
MVRRWPFYLWLLIVHWGQSQDLPVEDPLLYWYQRLDIMQVQDTIFYTDVLPIDREEVTEVMANIPDRIAQRMLGFGRYLPKSRKGTLSTFYTNQRDFLAHHDSLFRFFVNPLLRFQYGRSDTATYWENSRGVEWCASLFGKLKLYSRYVETQQRFPAFVEPFYNWQKTIPGALNYKVFRKGAFDYGMGYGHLLYYPNRHLRIKFGHDRLKIGDGYQSLFFSGFAPPHLQLQTQLRIWKIHYLSHFAQFIEFYPNKADAYGDFPRKYGAFHQLSFYPIPNLRFSFFEGVIYASHTNAGARGFELQYLNPLIFYRTVEYALGSPDNVVLGGSWKYNFLHHFQLYGQVLIDDYNVSKRREGKGWWGNKYGYQLGFKWINLLPYLDIQIEHNAIRPYTYAHRDTVLSYSHYKQPLGHPRGANLKDIHFLWNYQPKPFFQLTGRISYTKQGKNQDSLNFGHDPFVTDVTHVQNFQVTILQGKVETLLSGYLSCSFFPFQIPLFVDIGTYFQHPFNDTVQTVTFYPFLALRYTMAPTPWPY